MNAHISHRQPEAKFRAGRFEVTPESSVTVDAYSLAGAIAAFGSKRVMALTVSDGEKTWTIEVPAPVADDAPDRPRPPTLPA